MNFFRALWNNKVDMLLIISTLILLVGYFRSGYDVSYFLLGYALYACVVVHQKGIIAKQLDDNVTNPDFRRDLGLPPMDSEKRHKPKDTVFAIVIKIMIIAGGLLIFGAMLIELAV